MSSEGTGAAAEPAPVTLPAVLWATARRTPDRLALVEEGGRRLTWGELDREVDAVATGLRGLGLVAGYRVVIALGNRTELVAAYLGCLRAGLVAVPLNPRAPTGELVRALVDAGARLVLADPRAVVSVRQAVAGLADALEGAEEELRSRTAVPHVVTVAGPALPGETTYHDLLAGGLPTGEGRDPRSGGHGTPGTPLPVEGPGGKDPESLAVLLYTSGTSSTPRGVMLSHRALVANVDQVGRVEPSMLHGDDVVLAVVPLFHAYGLNAVLGQVLARGSRMVLVEGFDPERSLSVIEDEAVSVVPVAPAALEQWLRVPDLADRLSGVRAVVCGAAPLAPELAEAFAATTRVPVHQGYGLTETAAVLTSTLCSGPGAPAGSVGAAVPGVELRLVEESGSRPAAGDPGEIVVRGANLFDGYWPEGAGAPAPDGWFATGDLGLLDTAGNLFLVDRLTEVVTVSGFTVYPAEVEEVLAELAEVAEAAVIGVDGAEGGAMIGVYVRPAADRPLPPEDLARLVRDHCARRLAGFKHPTEVHVVDELPHTVTGKVAKGRLRAERRRRALGLLGPDR